MKLRPVKEIKWLAAALVVFALGAGGGYWWAHRAPPQDQPVSGEREVLYWHDPMKPDVKFDKPGKSPFMDMELVPVYADEADGDADVQVSANVVQNLGIRFGKVEKATLSARLQAVGSVAFDEGLLELVQARVDGYVTRLHVKAPLVLVRRGQPLAAIVAPQWLAAQQEYLVLLDARSPSAQSIREAARRRLVV
ncbi:MAG: efflux RND transporter periplasmic adaptor subunit, partial [Steroidobacteraceae bacterium]